MGRFITEDPIKDGNNWYAYCANNPLTFIDPTGLFADILAPQYQTDPINKPASMGSEMSGSYVEKNGKIINRNNTLGLYGCKFVSATNIVNSVNMKDATKNSLYFKDSTKDYMVSSIIHQAADLSKNDRYYTFSDSTLTKTITIPSLVTLDGEIFKHTFKYDGVDANMSTKDVYQMLTDNTDYNWSVTQHKFKNKKETKKFIDSWKNLNTESVYVIVRLKGPYGGHETNLKSVNKDGTLNVQEVHSYYDKIGYTWHQDQIQSVTVARKLGHKPSGDGTLKGQNGDTNAKPDAAKTFENH